MKSIKFKVEVTDSSLTWVGKLSKTLNFLSFYFNLYFSTFLIELNFHTLEITYSQISNMIEHFDKLDSQDQCITINSESWIKISVQDWVGTFSGSLCESQ